LGIRNASDVFIIDDPARFEDSMMKTWSPTDVSALLASAFAPELANPHSSASASSSVSKATTTTGNGSATTQRKQNGNSAAGGPPQATIDVLLTFDESGVSNHPNHRSLYHGAVTFLKTLMKDKSGYSCPVALYTLTTTDIVRKYIFVFDSLLSMFLGAWSNIIDGGTKKAIQERGYVKRLLFINSIPQWYKARTAMVDGHKSQMVWFRWGWLAISRYMVVNDLKREKI
jgi:N-acetylglucosaminylphosphatidylinositol deacetylase